MSLARFRSGNHPQQTAVRGARDDIDDRGTDPAFFMEQDARFNFSIDVAASNENALCARYFTKADNGLERSWAGERVWCNPPYSNIAPWVRKAHAETDALVVMLLPANRTEQDWWQEQVEPFRDRLDSRLRTEFIRGRLRFLLPGEDVIPPNSRPPFGVVLLIWEVS